MSSYSHHLWCFLKPLITPHVYPAIPIFRKLWLQWSQSPIYRRRPSLLEELLPSEGAVSGKYCDWPPRSMLSYLAPTCASLFGNCRAQGHWHISNRVEPTMGSAFEMLCFMWTKVTDPTWTFAAVIVEKLVPVFTSPHTFQNSFQWWIFFSWVGGLWHSWLELQYTCLE